MAWNTLQLEELSVLQTQPPEAGEMETFVDLIAIMFC